MALPLQLTQANPFLYNGHLYETDNFKDGHQVFVPADCQSYYCNYTLYKTDTSLRPTTNNFETVTNGQLESALCS